MKINKNLIILSLLLIFGMSLSAVSAADSADISVDAVSADNFANIASVDATSDNNKNISDLSASAKEDDKEINSLGDTKEVTDGNFDTLKNTIEGANAGDIIKVSGTYKFNSQITIYKSITVMSENGAILNGNKGRIFNITPNNVIIDGLTFINAYSNERGPHGGGGGSALYIAKSNVIVKDCKFINNTADGSYSSGGALFTTTNCYNISIMNCSFVNCSATNGGAIYFGGNGVVSDCSFVNCSAAAGGGAIYSMGKDTIVDYCSFVNCSGYNGGAIYWKGDNGSVVNCSFVSCSAMENGGAIHSDTYGSVVNCSFVSCRARYGGAISHDGGDGIINVNGCIFTLCNATEGKIIYDKSINGINWDGNFFTTNNTITADEFIANGFGYKEGKGNITPNYWVVLKIKFTIDGYVLEFVKNGTNNVVKMPDYKVKVILNDKSSIVSVGEEQFTKFYNESIDVYSLEGTFLASFYYYYYDSFSNLAREISNCKEDKFVLNHNYKFYENYDNPVRDGIIIDKPIIIEGNGYIIDGFNKSSVFKITSNNVIIKNLNFVNCDFSSYSGVIDLGGVNCSVVNCSFVNSSGSGDASECGAIFCGGVNCSVVNCSFVNSYGSGGAIYWNGTNGVVGNCSFVNSYGSGGAIFCGGDNGVVGNCSFVNCSTNAGGAIYLSGANGVVGNCSFVNCSTNVGGAIYLSGANGVVGNCSFVNCRAIGDGGGAIYWYPPVKSGGVGNCSFVNCSANTYGGAIYSYGVKDIVGCSFVNCSANNEGGAIECIRSDSEVVNCSFVGCNARNGGAMSGIYRYVDACIFENNKASSSGNALCLYGDLNVGDNFFVTNNTITSRDFIAKKFIYSSNDGKYVAPKKFIVLNIRVTDDGYVLEFVENGTNNVIEMPDYKVNVTLGDGSSSIVSVGEEQTVDSGNIIVINAYSLNNEFLANKSYARVPKDSFAMLAKEIAACEDGEFVLTHDYKYYSDMDADKDFINGISIDKPIIINGNGHIINGSNVARAFKVMEINGVVFKNLTFTDCSSKDDGGAIYWNYANGALRNCSFVCCNASYGGAVYWNGTKGIVGNCSFVNCSASRSGGAISWIGDSVVGNCSFVNCSANDSGGAIEFIGNGSVNYCVFDNNKATNGGNAIEFDYGGSVDFNFFGFQNNVTDFPTDLISGGRPNNWVVLEVTNSGDSYFVKFVTDEGNSLNESMPDYTTRLGINGITKEILIKNNTYNDAYVDGNYVVTSLNSGNVLANVTFKNDTNCSMNVSVDDIIYGEDVIVDVTLPSDATGNVTLFINNLNITKSVVDSKVSFNISDLGAGTYTFILKYSGDDKYPSKQYTGSFNVEKYTSTTTVTASDVSYGSDVTVNVNLDVVNGTGDIIYYLNGNEYATKDISNLTFVIKNLSAGTYYLTVEYSGDLNNTKSSAKCNFTVSKNNTYFMNVSAIDITYGEDVIINVTLPDDATGYVEVVLGDVDGNEQTYIGAVKNGTVIITVSGLDSGIYTVKVTYSGDNNYTSMSDNASFKVSKGDAFIDVNVNPVSYGDYHELTIMVPIDVTGYVNVTVNNKTYTAYVVYGEAIVDIDDSILDEGSYEAKVTLYDPNYNELSTSIELFVFKADSDFNVEGSTVNYGENSTIAVEVIVPSGDNGKVYIEGIYYDLIDGKATIDLGKYDAGEYNITVYYLPSNHNYWEAMSFAHLIVNKVMAEIAVNVSDIIYGEDAVITVSVPVDVTGTVKYYVDGAEYGTQDVGALSPFSVHDLTAGVHQVMIVYSGDNNYNQTIKETSLVVNKTGLTFDVSVEDITYGEDAVITVSVPVDVTGIVKYYVDGILYETQNVDDISPVVVSYLTPGYHPVMIVYSGDDNYKETIKETGFTVNSAGVLDSSIVVDSVSCNLGSPVDLVAHVVGDSGYVTFYVNDVELNSVKLVDGVAKLSYYANVSGNFVVKAVYSGSDLYNPSENTSTLVVTAPKLATSLSASTLTITAYTSKNLVVTLKDSKGKVLSGKKLTIVFNGKNYTVTTNSSGQAKLSISSKVVKNYTATIKFAGDSSYTASSKSVKVVIKPAYVTVADIIKAAKTLKSYSVKNKKLPATIKVGSYKLNHAQLTYLMTVAIKHIKAGKKTSTKVKVINVKYTAYNAKISKKIMKKGYLSVVNTLYSKGVKGTLPKYFTYGGKKIGYNPYAYSLAKILAFYSSKKRLPTYCVFVNY